MLKPIKSRFKREEKVIPSLRFGILHSHVGFEDGVSIVMRQLEEVITKELNGKKGNIFYLVGRTKKQSNNITVEPFFDFDHPFNQIMQTNFQTGFTQKQKNEIEQAISKGKEAIKKFVEKNDVDVIIAHNTSHPVNFIMAVALHRYYQEELQKGNSTPKYLLWWHDSHLEREQFSNPAKDIKQYLIEGIPGGHVEHVAFINSNQFATAEEYFLAIDRVKVGFHEKMLKNHDVIYNTTDMFIQEYKDCFSEEVKEKKEQFLKEYNINKLLKEKNLKQEEVIFCLQHTRMVRRKRIDFALKFAFKLLQKAKEKGTHKALYFLVSGNNSDGSRASLEDLYKQLKKQHKEENFFLEFVEDYKEKKTSLEFEEYPLIFNNLGGITTYFSAVEGFGNNLLEVLAAGMVPIIYQYPVYKSDIAKFRFRVLSCDKFEVEERLLNETLELLTNSKMRKQWGDRNIKLIRRHFSHASIASKLKNAILSKRTHWRKKKNK